LQIIVDDFDGNSFWQNNYTKNVVFDKNNVGEKEQHLCFVVCPHLLVKLTQALRRVILI